MTEIGHFPMSENYPRFKGYLHQALTIIADKTGVFPLERHSIGGHRSASGVGSCVASICSPGSSSGQRAPFAQ